MFFACRPVINPLLLLTSTSAWNCCRYLVRNCGGMGVLQRRIHLVQIKFLVDSLYLVDGPDVEDWLGTRRRQANVVLLSSDSCTSIWRLTASISSTQDFRVSVGDNYGEDDLTPKTFGTVILCYSCHCNIDLWRNDQRRQDSLTIHREWCCR